MRRCVGGAQRLFSNKRDFFQRFQEYKRTRAAAPGIGSGEKIDFADNRPLESAEDGPTLNPPSGGGALNSFFDDYLSVDNKTEALQRSRAFITAVGANDPLRAAEQTSDQLRDLYGRYDYYRGNYLRQQSNQRGKPQDESVTRRTALTDGQMLLNFARFYAARAQRLRAKAEPDAHSLGPKLYTQMLQTKIDALEAALADADRSQAQSTEAKEDAQESLQKAKWQPPSIFFRPKRRDPRSRRSNPILPRVHSGVEYIAALQRKYYTRSQRGLSAALRTAAQNGTLDQVSEAAARSGPDLPREHEEAFFDERPLAEVQLGELKHLRDKADRPEEAEYEAMRRECEEEQQTLHNCNDIEVLTAYFDAQQHVALSLPARFEMYENYLEGWSVRELSLKFGCHPARVKAVVWLVQNFIEDHLPRMTPQMIFRLMSIDMDEDYVRRVDYGIDLEVLAEAEKGTLQQRYGRPPLDHRPFFNPESGVTPAEVDALLRRERGTREEFVVERRCGRGQAYWVKNWVKYRGPAAQRVSGMFRLLVERSHYPGTFSPRREQLLRQRGPRAAARGASRR